MSLSETSSLPGKQRRNYLESKTQRGSFFVLFIAYIAIEFIRPQDIFPVIGVLRPAMILGILLAGFSISQFSSSVYKEKSVILLVVFVGLALLSVLFASNNYHAFNKSQTMVLQVFAAIIPMILLVRSPQRFRFVLFFWIAIHTYLAIYSLLHNGRGPGSFLADENDIALALNSVLPLTYFLAQTRTVSKKVRIFLLSSAVILVVAIVGTASRGGFVGLAITVMAMVWFSRNRIRNAVLLGAAALIFYALIPDSYRAEVESIADTNDGTRTERLVSWGIGWDMFVDNPILGVGAGNYPWRVSDYQVYDPSRRMLGGRAAHSLYFTLLPEFGVVGTVVYLWLIIDLVRRLRRTIRQSADGSITEDPEFFEGVSRGFLVGLVGFLVSAIFITVLYYPTFWMMVGFATVITRLVAMQETMDVAIK